MHSDGFNLDHALAMLEQTPARLGALLAGVGAWGLEADGGWSLEDVIAHLISGERVNWMLRARHILAGEERPFEAFDRSGQAGGEQARGLEELLAAFAELRRANVAALRGLGLTSADLERVGQHPELGEVRLGQLLAAWVAHDLDHLGQIVHMIAWRYRDSVGPWRAYLAILRDPPVAD